MDTDSESEQDKKKVSKKKASSGKSPKKSKKSKKAKASTTSSSSSSDDKKKKTSKRAKADKKDKSDDGKKKSTAGAALLDLLDDPTSTWKTVLKTWALSDVQKMGATVDTAKASLPDIKTLQTILAEIPDAVLALYDLDATSKKVHGMDCDPSKAAWAAILDTVKTIVDDAEQAHGDAGTSAKAD